MCWCPQERPEEGARYPRAELQVIVNFPGWIWGTEEGSSIKGKLSIIVWSFQPKWLQGC